MNSHFRVFGIRHHGPGSARSLVRVLSDYQPDFILIEGPPEGDPLLSWLTDPGLQPPVALLLYNPERPRQSVFYPFAPFSPEWQALRFGQENQIPVHFFDLSVGMGMALEESILLSKSSGIDPGTLDENDGLVDPMAANSPDLILDPISWAAEIAGYPDPERWWENLVEQTHSEEGESGVFDAIEALMGALRAEENTSVSSDNDRYISKSADKRVRFLPATSYETQREAVMRAEIRNVINRGYERIAVVCGAWHAPALTNIDRHVDGDFEILNILKPIKPYKIEAAWVPWDFERLGWQSGYGAGIESPAWYDHLWKNGSSWEFQSHAVVKWMANAALILRDQGLDGSPSHAIEAVRLSEVLAALRGRSIPGLKELMDAVQSVFCLGDAMPLNLVQRKLVVGEKTGTVPEGAPQTPLQKDLQAAVKSLRLQLKSGPYPLALDLRKENDLRRSQLLHRLAILDIPWGAFQVRHGALGTFHEDWVLDWKPEFVVRVIAASLLGNTVASAASEQIDRKTKAWVNASEPAVVQRLSDLTSWLNDCMLADLPDAIRTILNTLTGAAAQIADVVQLMEALPPLAGILRYGSVRKFHSDLIVEVINGIAERIFVGIPPACTGLGDDAAAEICGLFNELHPALSVNRDVFIDVVGRDHYTSWLDTLLLLHSRKDLHGLIAGRVTRILFDVGRLGTDAAQDDLTLALSSASDHLRGSAWLEGFLSGGGEVLVHDIKLLSILDDWLVNLSADAFNQTLPLLRRTFSTFTPPERQRIGEAVEQSGSLKGRQPNYLAESRFDAQRAAAVFPVLKLLLGGGDET